MRSTSIWDLSLKTCLKDTYVSINAEHQARKDLVPFFSPFCMVWPGIELLAFCTQMQMLYHGATEVVLHVYMKPVFFTMDHVIFTMVDFRVS